MRGGSSLSDQDNLELLSTVFGRSDSPMFRGTIDDDENAELVALHNEAASLSMDNGYLTADIFSTSVPARYSGEMLGVLPLALSKKRWVYYNIWAKNQSGESTPCNELVVEDHLNLPTEFSCLLVDEATHQPLLVKERGPDDRPEVTVNPQSLQKPAADDLAVTDEYYVIFTSETSDVVIPGILDKAFRQIKLACQQGQLSNARFKICIPFQKNLGKHWTLIVLTTHVRGLSSQNTVGKSDNFDDIVVQFEHYDSILDRRLDFLPTQFTTTIADYQVQSGDSAGAFFKKASTVGPATAGKTNAFQPHSYLYEVQQSLAGVFSLDPRQPSSVTVKNSYPSVRRQCDSYSCGAFTTRAMLSVADGGLAQELTGDPVDRGDEMMSQQRKSALTVLKNNQQRRAIIELQGETEACDLPQTHDATHQVQPVGDECNLREIFSALWPTQQQALRTIISTYQDGNTNRQYEKIWQKGSEKQKIITAAQQIRDANANFGKRFYDLILRFDEKDREIVWNDRRRQMLPTAVHGVGVGKGYEWVLEELVSYAQYAISQTSTKLQSLIAVLSLQFNTESADAFMQKLQNDSNKSDELVQHLRALATLEDISKTVAQWYVSNVPRTLMAGNTYQLHLQHERTSVVHPSKLQQVTEQMLSQLPYTKVGSDERLAHLYARLAQLNESITNSFYPSDDIKSTYRSVKRQLILELIEYVKQCKVKTSIFGMTVHGLLVHKGSTDLAFEFSAIEDCLHDKNWECLSKLLPHGLRLKIVTLVSDDKNACNLYHSLVMDTVAYLSFDYSWKMQATEIFKGMQKIQDAGNPYSTDASWMTALQRHLQELHVESASSVSKFGDFHSTLTGYCKTNESNFAVFKPGGLVDSVTKFQVFIALADLYKVESRLTAMRESANARPTGGDYTEGYLESNVKVLITEYLNLTKQETEYQGDNIAPLPVHKDNSLSWYLYALQDRPVDLRNNLGCLHDFVKRRESSKKRKRKLAGSVNANTLVLFGSTTAAQGLVAESTGLGSNYTNK